MGLLLIALGVLLAIIILLAALRLSPPKPKPQKARPPAKALPDAPLEQIEKKDSPPVKKVESASEQKQKPDLLKEPVEGLSGIDDVLEEKDKPEPDLKGQLALAATLIDEKSYEKAEKTLLAVLDQAQHDENIYILSETRFLLGVLSKAINDLTSACENWQMAKELLQHLSAQKAQTSLHINGSGGRIAEIEKVMRDNGCPTDWVLKDF